MVTTLMLRHKRHLAANAWLFSFEPNEPLSWQAGQFLRVELAHENPDTEGTKRYFTIASAPSDQSVEIATRLTTSTFKQTLANLKIEENLRVLDQPAGDFTWPRAPQHADQPLIFAAQGIGITPVRSLIRERLHNRRPAGAHLIYANPAPGVPFEAELADWTARDPTLRLTLVREPITASLLTAIEPNLSKAIIYVSGPNSLISLLTPPVNLSPSRLKQDQFPNYAVGNY